MKKIVILIDSLSIGGAQQSLKLLIPEWRKLGLRVEVIAIQKSNSLISFTEFNQYNVNVSFLKAKSMIDFVSFVKLLYKVFLLKPKQLQCHLYWSQIWGVCIKFFLPSIDVVWVEHNTYLKRSRLQWITFKFSSKFTQEILVVSDEVKDFLSCKAIKKLRIVWNPISDLFHVKRDELLRPVFAFVGRLVDQKAPRLALESFLLAIEKKYIPFNSELIVVGAGPLKGELLSLVFKSKYKNHIQFIDNLETADLAMLFGKTSTLISTSLFEGFAIVRAEALASGCTVVSTQTGGLSAILYDNFGETIPGVFIVKSDVNSCALGLAKSQNKNLWTKSSIQKRQSIGMKFSSQTIAKDYFVSLTNKDLNDLLG